MREDLKNIVEQLAVKGFRTAGGQHWNDAMDLMQELVSEFIHSPKIDSWLDEKRVEYRNFSCIFKGKSSKKIIIGAHYDTFEETPGADDNGSAVAVLLCLGRLLSLEKEFPFQLSWFFMHVRNLRILEPKVWEVIIMLKSARKKIQN